MSLKQLLDFKTIVSAVKSISIYGLQLSMDASEGKCTRQLEIWNPAIKIEDASVIWFDSLSYSIDSIARCVPHCKKAIQCTSLAQINNVKPFFLPPTPALILDTATAAHRLHQ